MKIISKLTLTSITITHHHNAFAATLGGIADTLFVGADVLTRFFWVACILVGVFLLTGCMVHYKEHRNNPKVVPLFTVIVYLILGLVAISIPFLNRLFGSDAYDAVNYSNSRSIFRYS